MADSLLCSVIWRSSDRDGCSSGFGADLRVLPEDAEASFLALCLQGALEREAGDWSTGVICLSSITSLSLLSLPFSSRLCPFRLSLSLLSLLHTTPSEELFFKMPLICTAFWELLSDAGFRWDDEVSSEEEPQSCEELSPERRTSRASDWWTHPAVGQRGEAPDEDEEAQQALSEAKSGRKLVNVSERRYHRSYSHKINNSLSIYNINGRFASANLHYCKDHDSNVQYFYLINNFYSKLAI